MSFQLAKVTLASDVATNGTITVAYPVCTNSGTFAGAYAHKAWASGLQAALAAPAGFTVSFGATSITVTYKGSTTLPAGSYVNFQFDTLGPDDNALHTGVDDLHGVSPLTPFVINLGAPITADTDNTIKAATSTELPNAATKTYTPDTDGTSPTDGVGPVVTRHGVKYWSQDVPRNVSVAASHASSIVATDVTVTGLDEYGATVVEKISVTATGTAKTAAGAKAFKWIRSIAITAAADSTANTINVGFGDVLGLHVALPQKGLVTREMEDGAAPTAGTILAAVRTAASATTGDVRGTYDPNSACDGSKAFELLALLPDPSDLGVAQYAG